MPEADIVAIAAELYAAPLAEFTSERNARARALRGEGDRDLAARISALPKPSAAAWLVNLLAREEADGLDRLLDLGSRLQAAQDAGDRALLRELGAERRALLAELTELAGARSAETGRRAGPAVLEEVQQSLQAALADEDAAAAIRTGRLVRSLQAEGLDPVDLSGAVAVGGRADPVRGAPVDRPSEQPDGRDAAAERRRAADQRAARAEETERAAVRAAEDAETDAGEAQASAEERRAAAAALRTELDELRTRVADAEEALAAAEHAADAARTTARNAAATAAAARTEAAEARAALQST